MLLLIHSVLMQATESMAEKILCGERRFVYYSALKGEVDVAFYCSSLVVIYRSVFLYFTVYLSRFLLTEQFSPSFKGSPGYEDM